jgi:pSer/pThr/pTyr-binding forkhead associated (FHA) protein
LHAQVPPLSQAAAPAHAIAPSPASVPCPRCGTGFDRSMSFCGVCGLPAADIVAVRGDAPLAPAAATPPRASAASAPAVAAALASEGAARAESRTDNFGAVAAQVGSQLVTILKDGSEGPVHRIGAAVTDLGRFEGNITLPDDPYLSPRHARIQKRGERHFLRDLGSVNGIYYRIREPVDLQHGDVVLVGQQVLRLELLGDGEVSLGPVMNYGVMLFGTPEHPRLARLVQLTSEGIPRDVFHLYRDETVIGRESGDVVFTDDVFLSRRHVAFKVDRNQRRVQVRDLGSSNGTLVLFRGEREIADGDVFRIGHHLFRFDASPRGPVAGAAQGGAR